MPHTLRYDPIMTPAEIHQFFVTAVGLHNSGNLSEAEKIYRRILAARPNHPDALHLLGIVAYQRDQHQAAATLVRKAIGINPRIAIYHASLAAALNEFGQFPEAAEAARKSVAMAPNSSHALNNLAFACLQMVEADAAADAARAALALKDNPNRQESYRILGGALALLGLPYEAVAAFRESLRIQPNAPIVHSDLIFYLEHDPRCDDQMLAAELVNWNQVFAAPVRHLIRPHKIDRSTDRRLRIGWVSGDFRTHVVARCLLPILERLDRSKFQSFCYSNVANPDDMTARIVQTVHTWREIRCVRDQEVAELIRSDRIDILVDLALHCGTSRLTLFALKPGPVQVTYLGYCGSTGLETMDYRISDPFIDPPGSDLSVYSERTIHLPQSFLCYRPEAPPPDIAALPSSSKGYVTFGCLNNPSKNSSDALQLWARILAGIPGSHLILQGCAGSYRQRVGDLFRQAGVAPDRLEFLPHQSWWSYMETYNRIDIAMDPFPYGGGVTSCDALLMGVPVVALCGARAAGRLTSSILSNIGHSELAATNYEQYVQIAVGLAANPAQLAMLRNTLRQKILISPVMDADAAAVNLGKLFQDIWQNYLSSTAPISRQNE